MGHYRRTLFRLLVAVCLFRPEAAGREETVPLADITERLTQQLRTIRSLHVTWHKTLGNEKPPASNVWAFQGSRFLDCGPRHRIGRGPYWAAFDGTHSFKVKYWRFDPSQVDEVLQGTDPNVVDRTLGLLPLGLHLPGTDETLISLLDRFTPDLATTEVISGAKSCRIEFGTISDVWPAPHVLTLWVDATTFLPRQLELHPAHTPGPPFRIDAAKGETGIRFTVGAFQQVVDEGSKEERCFPATLLNGPTTIVFDKVRLNPELPDSTFSPPLPPGTQLHTGRMVLDPISNRMVPEVIVIGGEEGKRVLARRQAKLREEGARIERERAQQPPDP